ncbi:hypothetical protein [Microcoleus sp. OTE_8_concoct_300]|uniref:hypothetical protein n=1 Tax=Microcoleus sp. OTE_8_concoct_300 TaxID=2964710 RepID=UPI00403F4BAC
MESIFKSQISNLKSQIDWLLTVELAQKRRLAGRQESPRSQNVRPKFSLPDSSVESIIQF